MAESEASIQVTMNVEEREVFMERIFDAPRELVFRAYSEPEHLVHWWGPKGWTLPVCNVDFRPGGVWYYCMQSPDGQLSAYAKAVYQEIIAPERTVYTEVFADEEGNAIHGMPERLITVAFVEHEGKTKLISQFQFASVEALQATMDLGMVQGFTEAWDRLDDHLKEIQ